MRVRSNAVFPVIAAFCSVLSLGCFEIEQSIELQPDMSGTADLKIGVDFEPMVLIMATMQRQMEGKEGPPSAEELTKAREEFLAQQDSEDPMEEMPSLEEANEDLPEGIRLLDMNMNQSEMRMVTNFRFGFDKLAQLVNLKLPSSAEAGPGQSGGVLDAPFENLELIEEGNTFTIRSKPGNPAESVEKQVEDQGAPPDPEMEKMMEDAFENLRFAWKIKAPFEVVSHNATQVDGDTLIWMYDWAKFKEMEKSGIPDDLAIRVTYRR